MHSAFRRLHTASSVSIPVTQRHGLLAVSYRWSNQWDAWPLCSLAKSFITHLFQCWEMRVSPKENKSQCNEIQEWTVISRKSFGFSCPPYLCLCCMRKGEVRAWACTCCQWRLTVETSFWAAGFTGNLASVLRGNFA